jgi:hypothetical protein
VLESTVMEARRMEERSNALEKELETELRGRSGREQARRAAERAERVEREAEREAELAAERAAAQAQQTQLQRTQQTQGKLLRLTRHLLRHGCPARQARAALLRLVLRAWHELARRRQFQMALHQAEADRLKLAALSSWRLWAARRRAERGRKQAALAAAEAQSRLRAELDELRQSDCQAVSRAEEGVRRKADAESAAVKAEAGRAVQVPTHPPTHPPTRSFYWNFY